MAISTRTPAADVAARAVLRGHAFPVTSLDFHPCFPALISADEGGWCIIWSLVTRRPQLVWRAHTKAAIHVQWVHTNRVLCHGRDNLIHIYRIEDHLLRPGQEGPAASNVRLPSAGDSGDQWIKPWLVFSMHVNALNFCAASVLSIPTGEQLQQQQQQQQQHSYHTKLAVPNTVFSEMIDVYTLSDASYELTRQCKAIAFQPSDDTTQSMIEKKSGIVMAVAWVCDKYLIAAYESGHVVVFEFTSTTTWNIIYQDKSHQQPVLSISVHPSRKTFITTGADARIIKHPLPLPDTDIYPQKPLTSLDTKHKGLVFNSIRSDGKLLATVGWDGMIRVFGYKHLTPLAVFRGGRQDDVKCLAFSTVDPKLESEPSGDTNDGASLITVKDQLIKQSAALRTTRVMATHWLAVGGKDCRVALYDIY